MSKSVKTPSKQGIAKTGEKIPQKSRTGRKTPKQIVDKHIKDKNDVITEEDFKNVQLDLGVNSETTHEPLDLPDNSERPKDEGKDHNKVTPWDVISE